MNRVLAAFLLLAALAGSALAATPATKPGVKPSTEPKPRMTAETFSPLAFRGIGPALVSGRVVDLAVSPADKSTWFVATAYGGLWKTTNAGTTFSPVFDSQGTPSIGCVVIDPRQPLTVWVGTGENNSQRSVGWGDGVYRSDDGGRTWKNVGLKASEHVGMIAIDPRNSDVVFVAAQGPLWAAGGDRGVYKTSDGGRTWKQVLKVDEWTGANEVWIDPAYPNVMYASTYQRHRKVWTLIDGGPGSGIWKSTDGGETWSRLSTGLPKGDMGRIGLAVTPLEPNVVYAAIESPGKGNGIYRSADAGASWEKVADQGSSSPQYYQKLFPDPKQAGKLYLIDTFLQVSDDYGHTWRRAGEKSKHVDNHVVRVDPDDTRHVLVGCDGGLYESFDRCETWNFFGNLPITQFYDLDVDNSLPFYYVYGGTQDNNSLGGPSRTPTVNGIRNSDWFVTTGGDGFHSRVDPEDPNIVYAESQHAGMVRYDRRNGEQVDIQPQPEPGEPASRWNWDTPILISPHSHTRLYVASQRVWRSDDRGDHWKPVSPDLSRQLDRNRMPVMGRVWSADAVAKNASTSFYGNIVALTESPKQEGLLYAGTDDGLVQVSEDGGAHWRRVDGVPGVGEYPYVSRLRASAHDAAVVYATFERHKMGDFKPYVYRSADRGRTWTAITGDLPANGPVYAFAEDPVNPAVLYAGTEFGAFFTADGGRHWVQLKGGLPVQSIRDMVVQTRDDALVLATFGRGFYVLDDLEPLRRMASETALGEEATLLPVHRTPMFVPASPLSGPGRAQQGESHYMAENPPFGARITYWLRDGWKSMKDARQAREDKLEKDGKDTFYPGWDTLRAEAREEAPAIVVTVKNAAGDVVRRIEGPASPGFHAVAWDLRWASLAPTELTPRRRNEFDDSADGPLAAAGTYTVSLARRVGGTLTPLGAPQSFECYPVMEGTLNATDRVALEAFGRRAARAQRVLMGAARALGEMRQRTSFLATAVSAASGSSEALRQQAMALDNRLRDAAVVFDGDPVLQSRNEAAPEGLRGRLSRVIGAEWNATSPPTGTQVHQVEIVEGELGNLLGTLRGISGDLLKLEAQAEAAGTPWTPGRLPEWNPR
jgi:photosystem II stability/assembly factor-like uncharacterized protein